MTVFHPSASRDDSTLKLRLLDTVPVRSADIKCVLDLTDFGDLVGIEILDLKRQLDGGGVDPPRTTGHVRWSYDDEIDALYVQVGEGRGQVQRSAIATTHVDSAGRIVLVEIALPRPA